MHKTNIIHEKNHWDVIYENKKGDFSLGLDRGLQRNQNFYKNLKNKIKGKIILDLGCGDSRHVFYYLNPSVEQFRYIGLDYSLPSLHLSPCNDYCDFIQFNLNLIPVKPKSVDYIFVFGLLMYFENYRDIFEKINGLLKPGGEIFLYESIKRNKKARNSYIILKEFKECINKRATILFEKKDYSPIRYVLIRIVNALKINDKSIIISTIIFIDTLVINTLGRIINFFNGRAVFLRIKIKD